jgi:hypothetical protein
MVPAWVAATVHAEHWEPVGGGYTRAPKWRAPLRNGGTVFVKAAEEEELVLRPLLAEMLVYESVRGPFLPVVHELHAEHGRAVIVLEDLRDAQWPPPYPEDVQPLFAALDAVAASSPPPCLRRLSARPEGAWQRFALDPGRLLALGLCSPDWLERALPLLSEAEARVPAAGDELVHFDVWADNLCYTERGAVLVDWAEARIGNAAIDVAFALLTLRVAGVVPPRVDDEPALAAFVTGVVATEASAPPPPWAHPGSKLREDQLADLRVALPWAAAALGLPPPG